MRILHVIPSLSLSQGGPSVALPIMERALAAEGVDVETITTNDNGPGKRSKAILESELRENGVTRSYFAKQMEFYKISFPLRSWLRREVAHYDIVHIHSLFSHPSVSAAQAARRVGVPYVVRPLGVLNRYGVENRRALLKKLSLKWIEGPILRSATAIHFTAEAEKEEAKQLGIPFHGIVIPLGLEVAGESDVTSIEGNSVLFLSRLDPKKNIEGLLKAWVTVSKKHPGWRLKMAGEGEADYEKKLHDMVKELGICGSIDWLGHVEGDTKKGVLSEASIYVLPSFSENFGIAAAEAMFAGKACIFTPGVAVGTGAIEVGAAIGAETNSNSIASSLNRLINAPDLRSTLGREAKRFAESELSAAVMGRRLREMYESILSR